MASEYKPPIKESLKNLGYGVIKLKYFIIIVIALLLEVFTLIAYLLNYERIVELDLFNASVLYGAISITIIVVAIGCLVIMRVDKARDKKKIFFLLGFKKSYQELVEKYSKKLSVFRKGFDNEINDIDLKLNYAIELEEIYNNYLEEFLKIERSNFLNKAFKYEYDHISKEKLFYNNFSSFSKPDALRKISEESYLAHRNYTKEIDLLEKSLKLTI